MIPLVNLKKQYLSIKNEIDNAINDVIDETAFISGKYAKLFEEEFSKKVGVRNCISTANGTDSLYIIMKSLGIGQGDEVITVANSWISSSETISQTGAKPVFVDIESDFFSIDSNKIEEKINKKTRALIIVHLHGQSCNMSEICQIAKKYNILIIEDCAQAHLTKFKNSFVGTFGIAGSFSFYPGKNLGAFGDAGCIITNDDNFAKKCRMFANHGSLVKHNHIIEGINSRMDGINANILKVKLKYLSDWTKKRVKNSLTYKTNLSNIEGVILPRTRPDTEHTFHIFQIEVNKNRDNLLNYLLSNDIQVTLHYPTPLPFLKCYSRYNYKRSDFPVAFEKSKKILSLPMCPELCESDIIKITGLIKKFNEKNRYS